MTDEITVTVQCPYCELEPNPNCPVCDGKGKFQATREEIDREYGKER